MGRDVHEALDEIRRLAGEIYPPLLLDRGLAEALRATASTASIHTHVEADDLDRYPSTVEATVYFCCREALRTARGARATVRVWRAEGAVRFEVADDGPADGREDGTLRDAGDRAEALGGALSISFEREGRRVAGSIPEEA
jgi:signal transduction histidine kinase